MCAKRLPRGVHRTKQARRLSHRYIRISGIRYFDILIVTRICGCGSCRSNRASRQPSQPRSRNYCRDFSLSELLLKKSRREFCWLHSTALHLDSEPLLGQVWSISQVLHEHYDTSRRILPKRVAKRSNERAVGGSSPRLRPDSRDMESSLDEPRICTLRMQR